MWQRWTKWLLQEVFAGEPLVVINMDETAVRHEYQSKAGNTIALGRRTCAEMRWCEEHIPIASTRAHCTLVAFVANDAGLQKHLPQIFLPCSSKRALSAADTRLFEALPAPIEMWSGSSGWVTADVLKTILTHLRRVVRAQRGMVKILLWMDAASQHVSVDVLNHAARLHIYILLVPASLTWLMQPLDVYVFARFKHAIREFQRTARKASPLAKLEAGQWISLTGRAIKEVICDRDWTGAFTKLGVAIGEHTLNKRLAPHMLPVADVEPRPPSDPEMEMLIGRHRVDIARHFLNGPRKLLNDRLAAAGPAAAAAASDHEGELVGAAGPAMGAHVPPALRLRRLPSAPPALPPAASP